MLSIRLGAQLFANVTVNFGKEKESGHRKVIQIQYAAMRYLGLQSPVLDWLRGLVQRLYIGKGFYTQSLVPCTLSFYFCKI